MIKTVEGIYQDGKIHLTQLPPVCTASLWQPRQQDNSRIVNIISYQADADLNQAIVTGVLRQERWIDFQTAKAAGLKGVKDSEVLAIAVQQERILVSYDLKTMPSEFAKFIRSNDSAGLIIVPQKLPIEVAIKELLMIWAIDSAEEWVDRIGIRPIL
ncbi:DUF5615 family PIN-like protein [Nostoc flagelliforme]|uniref:DUF5615 family PIN-like protein n=1 Tax=Nostoc flagelliforme TaxID=1306274 RepID=UPI0018EF4A0A|nr:DUF5615 family PIN-like protein [Nostoc flagelliforme]